MVVQCSSTQIPTNISAPATELRRQSRNRNFVVVLLTIVLGYPAQKLQLATCIYALL